MNFEQVAQVTGKNGRSYILYYHIRSQIALPKFSKMIAISYCIHVRQHEMQVACRD